MGDYIDWRLVTIEPLKKEMVQDEIDAVFEDVMQHHEAMALGNIASNNFGAIETADPEATDGYYLIKWIGDPYTLQEDTYVEGYKKGKLPAGSTVCRGVYFFEVAGARKWYCPPPIVTDNHKKIFPIRYVVNTNVQVFSIGENGATLPNGLEKWLKQRATILGAVKITDDSHTDTEIEIARRALLDYYEGALPDEQEQEDDMDSDDDAAMPEDAAII